MAHHCLSHVKDVDGLCSAALVLAANGGTFALTDYDDILDSLDAVPASATALTICDLGTNASDFHDFVDRLRGLAKRMPVTYIDHHYLTDEAKKDILGTGVDLRHDVRDCASVLTYLTYRPSLPESARLLALYGAVTDYMDGSAVASQMMESCDRHYVLFESTMLAYALAKNAKEESYPQNLVEELAKMEAPHTIAGVGEAALEQAEVVRRLAEEVRSKGTRLGNLAYMKTSESATGNVAKLLLGAFGVPVGVAYKEKPGGTAEFSLRSTSEGKIHLGKEIGAIAQRHGGSGGGHEKAAGCSVPLGEVQGLLKDLSDRIGSAR
ncbi:MAG TPA: DHHA1 domain-containing protein [Nitrososphaerales archaeon]|nr:DHHA1 domain-containing protein [Nitrososphaerales archaeon]HUK75439.1 DHHA1 domain-containing protein [Nitrososphaerales archaeon]